jgi:DNA-binding MarR family transcriptional regulator
LRRDVLKAPYHESADIRFETGDFDVTRKQFRELRQGSIMRLDFERYIPALLMFIANDMATTSSAVYRQCFGINATEGRVILLLRNEPNISAQRISQIMKCDKGLVSRAVRRLEKLKYILIRPDKVDSRRMAINLTTAGVALHDRIIEVALQREKLLLSGFSGKETAAAVDLLQRMLNNMGIVRRYTPLDAARAKHSRKEKRSELARSRKPSGSPILD